MKKLIYSLCLLTALPIAAQKKTFTAACLNVDGLPPKVVVTGIRDVNLNPEGPQEEGTVQISRLIQRKGWDIIGISENFNYNTQLMSQINGTYSAGTYRGSIPTKLNGFQALPYLNSKSFDTDGLNLLWKPGNVAATGEQWYLWNKRNGRLEDGADELINKGFRYYCVSLGDGLEVDVYIHHMDAEDGQKDNEAREAQMTQLVDMIIASNTTRPIIILGDTNCRYTRDKIIELMNNRLAEHNYIMHDPWIEIARKNEAKPTPSVGDDALMVTKPYTPDLFNNYQTQEVVDKIWWIENNNDNATSKIKALSYLHDTDFSWDADRNYEPISDHYPIVVEFEIEKTKEVLTTGTQYYIQNVGTGKYIDAGFQHGTRGIVSDYGNRISLEAAADNKFNIKTTLNGGNLGDNLFMDNATATPYEFSYDSERGVYNIIHAQGALVADDNNILQFATLDKTNSHHQWKLVTVQDRLEQVKLSASEENPQDATFMIRGANFSNNDTENTKGWSQSKGRNLNMNIGTDGLNMGPEVSDEDKWKSNFVAEFYSDKNKSDTGGKLSQTITGLPNGTYELSFQGFCRGGYFDAFNPNRNDHDYIELNSTRYGLYDISEYAQDNQLYINNNESWRSDQQVNGKWQPNSMQGAATYFNADLYTKTIPVEITNGQLSITINKHHANSVSIWIVVDNFKLQYKGPTGTLKTALDRVKVAIDDAQDKATAAGLTSYSNKSVVDRYNNRQITGNGDEEIHETYIALANADLKQYTLPTNLRYTILNNSFERGDLSEWNVSNGIVMEYGNEKNTENWKNGNWYYVSDSQGGKITASSQVTMPSGIYKLEALVSPGTTVTATGTQTYSVTADPASTADFVSVNLNFLVTNGKLSISAENASQFKADNFILYRTKDNTAATAYELIKLAMEDATARLKGTGKYENKGVKEADIEAWDTEMAKYQNLIDTFGDLADPGTGETEFLQIYNLLRSQIYKTKSTDQVFTHAIINNSFEFGNTYGWDVNFEGDTGVRDKGNNENDTYYVSNCDGKYLFNTWRDGKGTVISQRIYNLPEGKYKLSALAASDKGKKVYLEVKGPDETVASQMSEVLTLSTDKTTGTPIDLTFNVAARTEYVTICFGSANPDGNVDGLGGEWYKVDNFQLNYVGKADECFFYRRLLNALNEAEEVVYGNSETGEGGLLPKYQALWDVTTYREMVDEHLRAHENDDPDAVYDENFEHDPDVPILDGSGITEINDIYNSLRTLVLSQTESNADMTGAIKNNSFELSDLTCWDYPTQTDTDSRVIIGNGDGVGYPTQGTEGKYIFNCYANNNRKGYPITQTIPGVPAGHYKLTAKITSDKDKQFYLAANGIHADSPYVVKTGNDGIFEEDLIELDFWIDEQQDVLIGLYPSEDGSFTGDVNTLGPWYKVDDFHLYLIGRKVEINWTMETDTHGTIILPFDVEKDELERKGLKAYTITKSDWTHTPADEENNMYRILEFTERDKIAANTPYVVKKVGENQENQQSVNPASMKQIKEESANSGVYVFRGETTNTEDLYKNKMNENLLTGTLEERKAVNGDHHLVFDGDNVGFMYHGDGADHDVIEPYHAYINYPYDEVGVTELINNFYFYEPIQTINWSMETPNYGTLILPFNLPVSELAGYGLKAHNLTGVTTARTTIGDGRQYHLFTLEDPTTIEDDNVTCLKANTPYFITRVTNTQSLKKARIRDVNDEEKSADATFKGVATNQNEEESNGLLTGTFISKRELESHDINTLLPDNKYTLSANTDDNNEGFHVLTSTSTSSDRTLPAYHAYITPTADITAPMLLAEDPSQTWTMENADYGTIVIPVNWSVPEGYKAYSVSTFGPYLESKNPDFSYRMIDQSTVASSIVANTPYLIMKDVPEDSDASSVSTEPLSYTFTYGTETIPEINNGGILTGTYTTYASKNDDYVVTTDGAAAKGFEQQQRDTYVIPFHAYIKATSVPETEVNGEMKRPTYLVLAALNKGLPTGVTEIMEGEVNVDIYTLDGVMVRRDVKAAEALQELDHGIYILRSAKGTVKVIK